MNSKLKILYNGIVTENPTFVLMLGMCPTLGTTGSAMTGMSMGLATLGVLICSNVVISLIKNLIPAKVRIPAYIVVIATFVSVLQLVMEAYLPALNTLLGIFIPLIVVNCILLGRAEAFASRHGVFDSSLDVTPEPAAFSELRYSPKPTARSYSSLPPERSLHWDCSLLFSQNCVAQGVN